MHSIHLQRVTNRITGLLLVILASFSVKAEVIKFGANESPPFWSQTEPYNGMCGEIVHALSAEIGVEAEIEFTPLKRLIDDEHNNDLGNPSFYIKNQDFSAIIPIALFQNAFIYYRPNQQQDLKINSWSDMKGFKVGVLSGGLEHGQFFHDLGIQFEESYSQESLFKKLKLGRLDLVIEIDLVAKQLIKRLFPEQMENFHSILVRDSVTPIAMMIDSKYPNADQFGKQYKLALEKMIKNGRYHKIIEKYYGKDRIPENWFADMKKYQRLYRFVEVE